MKWIDPNDKTQEQFLPWIGEEVLFMHGGKTYIGHHTGGMFKSLVAGSLGQTFTTWDCVWMYPPKQGDVAPSTRELATNIRRNLKHMGETIHHNHGFIADVVLENTLMDFINHIDTLAQQIEEAP